MELGVADVGSNEGVELGFDVVGADVGMELGIAEGYAGGVLYIIYMFRRDIA
jgi:hypothetical protein